MTKKALLFAGVIIIIIFAGWLVIFNKTKTSQISPAIQNDTDLKPQPSDSFKEYTDPSGFTFSYPDNLSITKGGIEDASTYADIQLSSKEINGSLNLKITDSKFKSMDEWLNLNEAASKEDPKEVKLGILKALEIKTRDRLLLGALDQGVLFTIEMPLVEEEFWMKVYHKILTDFSFAPPPPENVESSDEVVFEGEEVVE